MTLKTDNEYIITCNIKKTKSTLRYKSELYFLDFMNFRGLKESTFSLSVGEIHF